MEVKGDSLPHHHRRGGHGPPPPSNPATVVRTSAGMMGGRVGAGPQGNAGGPGSGPECAGCQKPIRERYLLKALDQLWHEDCLKCACCDCRLGEVGSTLFTKANLILCKRDYLRLFGTTGLCSACNKTIPAFEMVMRARGNVYHLECFACQQCNHRFCVGDKFYLHENKILCEYDYEERMVFANLPYTYNLAHLKCQPPPHPSSNGGGPGAQGGPPGSGIGGPSLPCNPGSGQNQIGPSPGTGGGNQGGGPPNNGPGPPQQPPPTMTNGNTTGANGPDDGSSGYGSADSNFDGK